MRYSLFYVAAVVGLTSACSAVPPREASQFGYIANRNAIGGRQDSAFAMVLGFIDSAGYGFSTILDRKESFFAVLGPKVQDGTPYILPLKVEASSVALLYRPLELRLGDRPVASWGSLSHGPIDMLAITFDNMVDGPIATLVYRIEDGQLVRVFNDSNAGCQPAKLEDLDSDGVPELIAYEEDPSGGLCTHTCQMDFRIIHGTTVAWPRVYRWTGAEWVVAEGEYPHFYRAVARKFEEILSWLNDDPQLPECQDTPWLRGGQVFEEWAARASRLASGAK